MLFQPKFFQFGHIRRFYSRFKPTNFTKNHEWISSVSEEADKFVARVGITDYSQRALGDIVFVELPNAGSLYHKDGNIP
jgi:glycine cleavage system H protein